MDRIEIVSNLCLRLSKLPLEALLELIRVLFPLSLLLAAIVIIGVTLTTGRRSAQCIVLELGLKVGQPLHLPFKPVFLL